ncbi:MAG: hypothetical protein PHW63_10625 [Alphaproteobacteria bacterium]|nr:hypothetical protein [Alphaproteobacteria bacterium]
MLYSGPYSHPVHVYRKPVSDTWGDLPGNTRPNMPALYGYVYSHTITEATVVPRTTEIVSKSPENAKRNYTGKTLYCGVREDIESDDYIAYEDYAGKMQVFEVEGEGSNDYVSPYSGMEAGKEIFLGRVRHRQ